MAKLITVSNAQKEIKRLQHYVDLVESYEADTLEKWIIKEYAFTNSLVEVAKRANDKGFTLNGEPIDKTYAVSIVNGKAQDELHRLLRLGYQQKIKPNKRSQGQVSYYQN
ncbi:hypothetical protein QFZ28_000180 [Neobacillus niacini]|uniref:hypothetical protein n=1 Tax=Neobacillus niacini TaxID=86668 RepID=UPI002789B81C|nr:hypothetical protein [Neobacillus niacini]MDQ0999780.1 hypothetical protein [Neobacillus niacini]